MTTSEKAGQIVNNKMAKNLVFNFFDQTNKDIVEYIMLFGTFGIEQHIIWDLYEEWQEI